MRGAAAHRNLARCSALLAIVAFTACSAPDADRRRSALQSAQRVLAIDLSDRALTRRSERWAKLPKAIGSELRRTTTLPASLSSAAPTELTRLGDAHARATSLASAEAKRRPQLPDGLVPTPHALGQAVADDLDTAGRLLAGRRPLPEFDDRVHRTDPADDHPEATWWQRLRRRLWL